MKKIQLIIILSFFFFFVSFSLPQQQEVLPVEVKKISERLYEVLDGRGARGGAYIGDNGVLMVDAKMDKASVDKNN